LDYRPATPADEPFLRAMLWLAANWRDESAAEDDWPDEDVPRRYVGGFGRHGDAADDFRALSHSVEPDNPALRLYERARFEPAGGSGGSVTLLATL
jgi:hypothetical protein